MNIPESEYRQMNETIRSLEKKVAILQDRHFMEKLTWAYRLFCEKENRVKAQKNAVTLKRGSGKSFITYIAEDFDAPLDDFKEYME